MGIDGGITLKRNLVGLYDAAAEQNIIVRQIGFIQAGVFREFTRTHAQHTNALTLHTYARTQFLMMPETGGTTDYFFFDDARDRGHH